VIKTIRLFLEPVKAAHAPKMFAGLRDERAYRFLADAPPESVEKLAARYALLAGQVSPNGAEIWLNWMCRRRGEEFYVGYVQATILKAERAALIAYHLFPPFWGQGLAREAVKAMLGSIGPAYGLREARAYIDTRHKRSIRLVEALGFRLADTIVTADSLRENSSEEYLYILKLEG
jgi:RimJ/RimL family protein N-acetyltransferase